MNPDDVNIIILATASVAGFGVLPSEVAAVASFLGEPEPDTAMAIREGIIVREPNGWRLAEILRDHALQDRYFGAVATARTSAQCREARRDFFIFERGVYMG